MKTLLIKAGCSEQLASDYMQIRDRKKAPSTQTAFDGIAREAEKAGITIQEAIQECVERNWVGFKAEWYNKEHKSVKPSTIPLPLPEDDKPRHILGVDDEYIQRMRKQVEEQRAGWAKS